MRALQILRTGGVAALAVTLCSCASVSVENVARDNGGRVQRPQHITVEPFAVRGAEIKEHPMRKHPGQLGAEAQKLVADYLATELSKLGIPASVGHGGRRSGEWIVAGRFTRIVDGSRLLRMGIGLGFGGTKMETQVEVRSASAAQPVLAFGTTGGSNATPGAATSPIPFSAAPTALLDSKEGVTDDSARTARMIAATVGEYMVKRGWIDASKVPRKPKMKQE